MINITITDVFDALNIIEKDPKIYRTISIASHNSVTKDLCKEEIKTTKEWLYLEFDDLGEEQKCYAEGGQYSLATEDDCRKALQFLEKGGACLVHCHAGVSRSTAVVLGFLLSKFTDFEQAIDKLFELRACADPNTHVLKLMCQILNIETNYQKILNYITTKKSTFVL